MCKVSLVNLYKLAARTHTMVDNAFLKPKLQYRFSCFIVRGDFAEDIVQEETDSSSDTSQHCEQLEDDKEFSNEKSDSITIEKAAFPEEKVAANFQVPEHEEQKLITESQTKEEQGLARREEVRKNTKQQLINKGYLPKDGSNPHIYSTKLGIPPNSFLRRGSPYDPKAPPPTYFSEQELYSMAANNKEEILKGFSVPPEGGLLCTDKNVMKRQSEVMTNIMGQMIKSMGGARVSLPVNIFEAKGLLERVADVWRFAPTYLTNAARMSGLSRFKQVITFAAAGIYCSMQQLKPFNPLLGETLEASMSDGTSVSVEHTSHNPIVYHFLVNGADNRYKLYGHHNFKLKMSANTMEAFQDGPNIIEFADGHKINYCYPKAKVHGLIMGKRMVYPSGVMEFEDRANNLKAVIIFNYGKKRGLFSSRMKGSKIDHIDGIIYHPKNTPPPNVRAAQLKDLKDIHKVIAKITGSWLNSINIDNAQYWNIDQVTPSPLKFEGNPLPSDWRFREDIVWLRREKTEYAQEWKLRLETEQRKDRALRAECLDK
eukprot:TRINITY_DN2670_c0_g1_i3.p1 TRINITY_DN2670_c0_g1~~TRINITY_DN2670_c0_g1_i3.p1  ORF type:complete len:542 (+),score=101.09 TRINITY_DN2670_c0_g1_i3:1076-2701(+)